MIQIDSLVETMRAAGVPEQAFRSLLAEIVGKKTFRLRVRGQEGYLIYRNAFYVFQPIRLADVRIPLALRIADVPVRKDSYEPGPVAIEERKIEPVAAVTVAAPEAPVAPVAPAATDSSTAPQFWTACVDWATTIDAGTSDKDIPAAVLASIEARYKGDEFKREYNILVMISWMYEDIQQNPVYPEEQRSTWRKALGEVLLELVWDGSLSSKEQLALLQAPTADETLRHVALQQRVKKGSTEAFRFVVPTSGAIEYICADGGRCSDAVVRLFEGDKTDPINSVKADRTTTGRIYGMILPKLKEGTLVFKTNDRPVEPGAKPEKGGECEIVSNIESHKKGLREIREMIVALGYPAFLLREEVLEEKKERQGGPVEAKKKKKGVIEDAAAKVQTKLRLDARKFQNVVKACALKNIILRFIDKLETGRAAGKHYFFRPIAAIKAGHKLR